MSEKRAKLAGNKYQLTVALQGTMRRIQAVERAYQATVRRKPINHDLLDATKGAVKYALEVLEAVAESSDGEDGA